MHYMEEWEHRLEITSYLVDQKNEYGSSLPHQKMSRVVIGCRVAVPRSHWSAVPTPLFDNMATSPSC